MCAECNCNSLVDNNWLHLKMLAAGSADLGDIPRLKAQAQRAERDYQALMENAGWTPEELLRKTGYQISSDSSK